MGVHQLEENTKKAAKIPDAMPASVQVIHGRHGRKCWDPYLEKGKQKEKVEEEIGGEKVGAKDQEGNMEEEKGERLMGKEAG